jgi:hypothetical protein
MKLGKKRQRESVEGFVASSSFLGFERRVTQVGDEDFVV